MSLLYFCLICFVSIVFFREFIENVSELALGSTDSNLQETSRR